MRKTMLRNVPMLLIALLMSVTWAKADDSKYKSYDWDAERKRLTVAEEDKAESALILKDFKGYEYHYTPEGQLALYSIEHKIIWVNSDDAIEGNNKVFVPLWDVVELVEIKARTIKKNGEIVLLDKNNIKEIKNEETGGDYKIFAIEGVEIDSEIEYFYVVKMQPSANLYGNREYFQYSIPSRNATFELISPANLEFSFKSYNNFPKPKQEIVDETRFVKAEIDKVNALKQEEFAMYNANRMRVEYKLGFNHSRSDDELYTWDDAAERIFENIHATSKEEDKAVASFYKKLKIKKSLQPAEKIKAIENHLKTNFTIQKGYADDYFDIGKTIENRYSNETGVMRLYAALFARAGVQHELGLTTDRSNIRFDGKFNSWKYLSKYIFFFPETGEYLCPSRPDYRYGMIPYYWTHNYGLFIKPIMEKESVVGKAEVRFIEALAAEKSFDNLTIDVNFSDDMEQAAVALESNIGGYNAAQIQPFYPLLPEDNQKEVAKSLIQRYAEDAEFDKVEVFNGEKNLSPLNKPFIIKAAGKSSSFIEKAGPKYLFKLGSLIGPQVEMYQENERQNVVENDFNRLYDRTIKFNIPEGYQIKNMDDINLDVNYGKDGNKIYTFESAYEIKGNQVEVHVLEYYKEINCPIEDFEAFRKVINAAADFNKITLVIEKK